jgi:transcriptional regulator with XRE-family HTH domain
MNLRELRFKKGKTQYDICKFSGVPQSRISLIERGYIEPTRKEKIAIAKALKIDFKKINWKVE